jgi:ankyrin repeat protein
MNSKITLLGLLVTFSLLGMEVIDPNKELIKFLQDAPDLSEDTDATIKTVKILLKQKASINYQTADGKTPFIAALLNGSTDETLQHLLFNLGADPKKGFYDKMNGEAIAKSIEDARKNKKPDILYARATSNIETLTKLFMPSTNSE